MEFLYFLESIRNPVCDAIFSAITFLGSEALFIVIALMMFWCVDKREGYYVLTVGLFGILVNQFAKLFFKVPRPWLRKPGFEVVGNAAADAGGYSFPSGHTQNVTGTLGGIFVSRKKIWERALLVSVIVLVAFSRMYLGVHTPADVLFSLCFAVFLLIVTRPMFTSDQRLRKCVPYISAVCILFAIGLTLYAFLSTAEDSYALENLYSARKNAVTMLGCSLAFPLVYYFDTKVTRFETKAKWYVQVLKIIVGVCVVFLLKEGLSAPLVFIFKNEFVARAVRYFVIVLFAGCIYPIFFKYFSLIGEKRVKTEQKEEPVKKVSRFNKNNPHPKSKKRKNRVQYKR